MRKFSEEVKNQLQYYVYMMKDPETDEILYVGKGNGNRVLNRKMGEAYILSYGMDEKSALAMEASLIEVLRNMKRLPKLRNKKGGDKKKCDCMVGPWTVDNIEDRLSRDTRVLAISVNKSYPEKSLYEAVRGEWALDPENANRADYVLAVKDGVVIGVFKTDEKGWQPSQKTPGRYFFEGYEVNDPKVRKRFINLVVEKKKGESNPIKYLYIKI